MRKAKPVYSELAMAKQSATITCIWQVLKGRQEWEDFTVRKRKTEGMP